MENKILILEHDPNDIELIRYELKKSTLGALCTFVENEETFKDALIHFSPDVILSDFNLPNFDGIRAYEIKKSLSPETPFIIVSGTIGEQKAVDLIKMGVTDYVLKDHLYQIPIKISRALEEARERKLKLQAESLLSDQHHQIRNILESITDGFFSITSDAIVNYWNQEAYYLLGKKSEEIVDKQLWSEFNHQFSDQFYQKCQEVLTSQKASVFEDYFKPTQKWLHVNAYPSKDGVSFFIRDVTDNKRIEHVNLLEREIIENYNSTGSNIETALESLMNGISNIHPELYCGVDRVEDDILFPWTYGFLSARSITQTKGFPIASAELASTMAAKGKTTCTVNFINENPSYRPFKEMGMGDNLKSCVAYPIVDTGQRVIGILNVFLETTRPLTSEEERTVQKAVFILQHIIESHLAELSIKESEKKYKKLFDLNPTPMWVYDQENLMFLDVNKAAINHYGFPLEEFLTMTIRDLFTPKSNENFEPLLPKIKSPFPISGTFEHRKKNGEIIHVASKSNFIYYAGKKARLVLINDITDKVLAKRALELTEMRFKALVQNGSDLINVLDLAGNLTYANPSSEKLLTQDSKTLIGKNAFEFVHDDDKHFLSRGLNLIKRSKRAEKAIFRYRNSAGNFRWLESTITNLIHDPAVQGILVNSNDITEKINHINAIELQNSKLKEIAWIQSHVVRAPLARILGLTDLIMESEESERKELLNFLHISALELNEVIQKIVEKSEEVEKIE